MTAGSPHASETATEIRSDLASLRRVWSMVGPMRTPMLIGIGFKFLQSMALGLGFGTVVWVVTGLADGTGMTAQWAWQITGLMALSLLAQIGFSYLSSRFNWLSSYRAAGDLRLAILDRLRQLPMGFHLSRHKGDTVSVLTSDMQMIESFLSDALPRVAQAFGLPLVIIGFLLARDWVTALTAMISILIATPVFLLASRRLARLGIQRQDRQARAAARMIEYVQGIAVIRAFNQIARGEERFDAALRAFRDISVSLVARLVAPFTATGVILTLGAPLVIAVAAVRYVNGALDPGTMISVLVLLFSIYGPFMALIAVMELVRIADASLTRMDRIMTAPRLPAPTVPQRPDGFALAFRDVSFGYRHDEKVLDQVSFTVPARTMTAIIGPSGAGKSTILTLIARFWDVESGAITLGGADVRALDEATLSGMITMVFQDVYLFAGTLYDNIAMGRAGATQAEVEAAARKAQAHDFIAALPDGYDTRVGEGGATLSGGERQRISIARAMLKDAPIVLLDEATAAIDPTNERAIQTALSRLVADKTLIVVAHRLSTIQSADQIIALENGRIAECGTHGDLIARNGLYARLWSHRDRAEHWTIAAKDTP